MDIYILIKSFFEYGDERDERNRFYFRKRKDAVAKARELMDADVPKRRKTRQQDIDEAVNRLDNTGRSDMANVYYCYKIIKETLN